MRAFLILSLLFLTGCPSREFYLDRSEVPWESAGIRTLELPVFEAPAEAWSIADSARREIAEALSRGTVVLVEKGRGQAVLQGAIVDFTQVNTPAAPRRVLKQTTNLGGEEFTWDQDVTSVVQFTLSLRLISKMGEPLWSHEEQGRSTETNTVTLNWPGADTVAPPPTVTALPEPGRFDRMRRAALTQALEPLINALVVHYAYRNLDSANAGAKAYHPGKSHQ